MKIAIATYHFYPENTPRAFRAFELAKEFSRQGHQVVVYTAEYDFNYVPVEKKFGISIRKVKPGFLLNTKAEKYTGAGRNSLDIKSKNFIFGNICKRMLKKAMVYVYAESIKTEYFFTLFRALRKDKGKYDLLISNALPFSVHLGCCLALRTNKNLAKVKTAEYGDPFSLSNYRWEGKYLIRKVWMYLERIALKKFDFITTPNRDAAKLFELFKEKSKIKVIPQGYDFSKIKTAVYKKNDICTFAYAGIFYETIRNPKNLFDFLSGVNLNFRFLIYTKKTNWESLSCIIPYLKRLNEKLVICDYLEREKLIYELSKCDFLININNATTYQTPSKIIDYALAGRPFFSCSQNHLDEKRLLNFLDGIYDTSNCNINLEDFDIKNVAASFIELAKQ